MPKEAKIYLTEDDTNLREATRRELEFEGHRVVHEAHDLETALDGVKTASDLGVNVAVLDGNLTRGDVSCSDGMMIASALRARIPQIKIVAFTSSEKDPGYGDIFVQKGYPGFIERLIKAVGS